MTRLDHDDLGPVVRDPDVDAAADRVVLAGGGGDLLEMLGLEAA